MLLESELRVRPVGTGSEKGAILRPFENLPHTHVNIGFYSSDPPGRNHIIHFLSCGISNFSHL